MALFTKKVPAAKLELTPLCRKGNFDEFRGLTFTALLCWSSRPWQMFTNYDRGTTVQRTKLQWSLRPVLQCSDQ